MLDQNLYNYAKPIVSKEGYTTEEQRQFKSRLERTCLDNLDFPPAFVMNCLLALGETKLELFVPAKS